MLRFAPLALLIGAGGADDVQSFDARVAVAPQPVVEFAGEALAAAIGRTGPASAPGARVTLYLNVPTSTVPRTLHHRLAFTIAGTTRRLDLPAVAVDRTPLPELGPPLRRGPWVAVYDPAMERGHRPPVNAVVRFPGR
ncbi:hypothetical protein [Sphingomonas sp. DT-204]|uniref:hypothetical protein n=1 Tax=Sphingomonas sp. DT-204 TaxID=3396166 RepID=UPI003F1DE9A1